VSRPESLPVTYESGFKVALQRVIERVLVFDRHGHEDMIMDQVRLGQVNAVELSDRRIL
jgi:hypothetical protein